MAFRSVDPSNGELRREWPDHDGSEVERLVAGADRAARDWASASLETRAAPLRRAGALLRERADELAGLMADEMGKPLPQGRAEAEKCAWVCEAAADQAPDFLASDPVALDVGEAFVAFRPLGVILAVMPWNFPLWQVFRFAAPALMAGNGALVKHAPGVPACADAIDRILRDADLPPGLVAHLRVPEEHVATLLADDRVRAATLTGSTRAGRAVAEAAGRNLKPCVLELGGSDPYVVLDDADLELAAETCVTARLVNSGQTCVAAKRFLVTASRAEEFTERVVAAMARRRVGDPRGEPAPDLGPLARTDLRDALHDQVTRSLRAGARLRLGGEVPDRPGAWYPPTVLAGVTPGMPAFVEETFGPVAAVVPARDEDDAVRLANATPYGLGAAVFTRDRERGRRFATDRLHAGCVFVNDFVKSDPRLPFGGIKDSGFGRELGVFGMRQFTNVKSVVVLDAPES